jgi:hypothetical protein
MCVWHLYTTRHIVLQGSKRSSTLLFDNVAPRVAVAAPAALSRCLAHRPIVTNNLSRENCWFSQFCSHNCTHWMEHVCVCVCVRACKGRLGPRSKKHDLYHAHCTEERRSMVMILMTAQDESKLCKFSALWRMVYSGMLRRAALVRTDVSEELSASFIRVTRSVN